MYQDKKIAVVLGGPSAEAEVSRVTGKSIAGALREKQYNVVEIDLEPHRFYEQMKESGAEVVFIAVHGLYGEDGRLQSALEMLGLPYTGSGVCASAMGMDKAATKRVLLGSGIPTPKCEFLLAREYRTDVQKQAAEQRMVAHLGLPCVVKPASQGSSLGMSIVKSADQLPAALELAFGYCDEVLVETYIDGPEVTVCMLEHDGAVEVLPIILIKPHAEFYDYHAKYAAGGSDHICPAPLEPALTKRLQELSLATYRALGCCGVARTDVMLDKQGNAYVLEINTVPGMTPTSLVPDAARHAGYDFPTLCEMILNGAHR